MTPIPPIPDRKCCICGCILTHQICRSCTHEECEKCELYVSKPTRDELDQMTKEQLDAELREFGINPEQLVQNAFSKLCVVMRAQSERIAKLDAEVKQAKGYAGRMFLAIHPQCTLLPDLMGVLTQIDNALTAIPSLEAENTRLKAPVSDEEIKHMVDRFLNWTLPESLNPDGGISFKRSENAVKNNWPMPTGTNFLDAQQAEQMVRYMVDGLASRATRTPPQEGQ